MNELNVTIKDEKGFYYFPSPNHDMGTHWVVKHIREKFEQDNNMFIQGELLEIEGMKLMVKEIHKNSIKFLFIHATWLPWTVERTKL